MDKKTEYKYILRRVGFVFIALLLIIIILCIILSNKKTKNNAESFVQETLKSTENLPVVTPIIFEKKTVLIYHTHNDESFYKGSKNYVESDYGRSFDEKYNILAVGNALKNNLKSRNFKVIHDKCDNVSQGFDSAYDTCYKNIEKYIDTIDIFIDVHRDAYSNTNKNYLENNTKQFAFIKMVVANGTNYNDKPHFNENLKFAETLDEKLNEIMPGISKGVFLKEARLNQHVSDFCLLIEIGNEKNNIEQALNSTEIIAEALKSIFY